MKWLILGLLALGCTILGYGLWLGEIGKTEDERDRGTWPVLIGGAIVALDALVAAVWFVVRAF